MSSGLLSTARLAEGSKARVYPLSSKTPQWLTPLSRCEEARTIRLREISKGEGSSFPKPTDSTKGKNRDWLPLLLREALGMLSPPKTNMNYTTNLSCSRFEILNTVANRGRCIRRPESSIRSTVCLYC